MITLHIDEQRGWRGGEQQASYLMQGLAARGHTVMMAGRHGAPFLTRDHGMPDAARFALPFRGEFDLLTAWRLSKIVQEHRVDILHAHTSHAHTAACIARWLAGRGKVVVSRRVDFPPKTSWFSRWKYAWPDHYIAISRAIAQVLDAWGMDAARVTVVHSAIDPARVCVAPITRDTLGVPVGVPLVGMIAALVGHKSPETFVDAMALVCARCGDAHAVLVGDGPLRPSVEARVHQHGLKTRFHLLGQRDDVPEILRALDVFVLSSREEGLGTSILDAMAAGVPVAATAAGGIPEVVRNGETGRLAPVGDAAALGEAILSLLESPETASNMADAAKRLVHEKYATPRMVEGNLAVYQRLLNKQ